MSSQIEKIHIIYDDFDLKFFFVSSRAPGGHWPPSQFSSIYLFATLSPSISLSIFSLNPIPCFKFTSCFFPLYSFSVSFLLTSNTIVFFLFQFFQLSLYISVLMTIFTMPIPFKISHIFKAILILYILVLLIDWLICSSNKFSSEHSDGNPIIYNKFSSLSCTCHYWY